MRLCLHWPRFGPYHLARLHAVHLAMDGRKGSLIALETSTVDSEYAWRKETGRVPFVRRTVFESVVPEKIPPRRIRKRIFETLDSLDPDVVAINGYSGRDALACLEWCRARRRGAVLMTDSKADDAIRIRWRELIKRWIVSNFDSALCAGRRHLEYLVELGVDPRRVFQGCDVVDNAFFAAGAQAGSVEVLPGNGAEDGSTPFFLSSSRFLPRKNLEVLLRAYAAYRSRSDAPWRLVVLGDGEERGRLEALVVSLGLREVCFPGFRQIDELPLYYGRAGAFVHPALQDQWALVVNEAMAAGLPVIVSRTIGCVPDLVDGTTTGLLFDPTRRDQLAELLLRVSSDAPLRTRLAMGALERISQWGLERFSSSVLAAAECAVAGAKDRCGRGRALSFALLGRDWSLRKMTST